MNLTEEEFAKKIVELLDELIVLYNNIRIDLNSNDYRSVEQSLKVAKQLTDSIDIILRGKTKNYE